MGLIIRLEPVQESKIIPSNQRNNSHRSPGMPRYFFHIEKGERELPDEIGEPDSDAAWKEATITAGKLLQDMDGSEARPGMADGRH